MRGPRTALLRCTRPGRAEGAPAERELPSWPGREPARARQASTGRACWAPEVPRARTVSRGAGVRGGGCPAFPGAVRGAPRTRWARARRAHREPKAQRTVRAQQACWARLAHWVPPAWRGPQAAGRPPGPQERCSPSQRGRSHADRARNSPAPRRARASAAQRERSTGQPPHARSQNHWGPCADARSAQPHRGPPRAPHACASRQSGYGWGRSATYAHRGPSHTRRAGPRR